MPTPVLFLDIDGTVRHGPDQRRGRFVNSPDDVQVFPEAVVMMHRWRDAGGRIVGISNQGGIALGHLTIEQAKAAMQETHRQTGELFDVIHMCPHHPAADQPGQAHCWCRKPKIGMLLWAVAGLMRNHGVECPPDLALMVGDRPEDAECARRAGINFLDAAAWRAQAGPVTEEFALVHVHAFGNERQAEIAYDVEPDRHPSRKAAIAHGLRKHGHDDWLIAVIQNGALARVAWMYEDRNDPGELATVALAGRLPLAGVPLPVAGPAEDPRPTTGGTPVDDRPSGCCCHLVEDIDYGDQCRPPQDGCPVHTPWAYPGYQLAQEISDYRLDTGGDCGAAA